MRLLTQVTAAIVLFVLGAFAGQHFLSSEPSELSGLFADQALARAVIEAGALELTQSDCALSAESGTSPNIADFVVSYTAAAALPPEKTSIQSECGGRGADKCSVSYSVIVGEKADTNILLFSRDEDGRLVPEDITCIAQ